MRTTARVCVWVCVCGCVELSSIEDSGSSVRCTGPELEEAFESPGDTGRMIADWDELQVELTSCGVDKRSACA